MHTSKSLPTPGGRRVAKAVDEHAIRSAFFESGQRGAALAMRSQGFTIRQISEYTGLTVQSVQHIVLELPSPNIPDVAQHSKASFNGTPEQRAWFERGLDRFQSALDQHDVAFFRGVDDISGCNRVHQVGETLISSHDPLKLVRCIDWLAAEWPDAQARPCFKVIRRGPDPVPPEWVAWWSAQVDVPVAEFDRSQVINSKQWRAFDHLQAAFGALEVRYRNRRVTSALLGVFEAKRDLRTRLGLRGGKLPMADYVLGDF
jgi:hypothetical protein